MVNISCHEDGQCTSAHVHVHVNKKEYFNICLFLFLSNFTYLKTFSFPIFPETSGQLETWWRRITAMSLSKLSRTPCTIRPILLNSEWTSSPPCSLRRPRPTLNCRNWPTAWSSNRWSFGVMLSLGKSWRYARSNPRILISVNTKWQVALI